MQPQARYRKGDKIGDRYLVHQALTGGMGEVYLCLDLQENQPFALKTFQQRFLSNTRVRKLFEDEVAAWVALEKHPHIVRCFHLEKVDNRPFTLLEWVAGDELYGTDLRDRLVRRGKLDPRTALQLAIDVCRALVHADKSSPAWYTAI